MQSNEVRTTCPYCGVGCGVIASIHDDGRVEVRGDDAHPANYGRLCSKGTALGETVHLGERLLYPEIAGEQVSWEQAYEQMAQGFRRIMDEHGPDAVAFYVSGQLLTEDYYVANKLMKGFIGSANIDTNSRLCMSSAVAAHKRAFGEDVVPCSYEDLERARMIVLAGSNTAWAHPVVYQRIEQTKLDHPDTFIVSIDPRRTQTSELADLHLAIRPGSDAVLFNGLLVYLYGQGEVNEYFVSQHTRGLEAALESARSGLLMDDSIIESVARQCELNARDVERFYQQFERTERVVSLFSQGLSQSSSGVDKINALINCHLITGRIGRKGMGPFSITGQPNAMGGREVGGLANQLAAHLDIENSEHRQAVQEFWQSPVIASKPGLKAVDCFDAIHDGRIKAIWIMATNPVVSLPNSNRVIEALEKCELVVLSDCVRGTDTARYADICLPATTWGERDGTVTNSERRISRQRPFLRTPGLARHDWQIITGFAKAMGYREHFAYRHALDIFDEYAHLTAALRGFGRQLDLSGLVDLNKYEFDQLQPVQWPVTQAPSKQTENQAMFANGCFSTDDGRARFIAISPRSPVAATDAEYPYVLNTGRIRDHWHTMTRTGMSPRLSAHRIEPFVDIHPQDALASGVADGELALLKGKTGAEIFVRTRVTDSQSLGSVFVPMHWNNQFASQARIGSLIPENVDPISGQPEFKHAVVNVRPCQANWYGFIISRHQPELKYARYWARSRGRGLWRYEVAGQEQPDNWPSHARSLLNYEADEQWSEFFDEARGHFRAAHFVDGRLDSVIFIDSQVLLPPRDWLIGLFQQDRLSQSDRASLLSGAPADPASDTGRIICACFNVGEKTIQQALAQPNINSVEAVGALCKAGTNCGSCRPEIAQMISAKS